MAEITEDPGAERPRPLVADDFPYRSRLLANLSALILLWDSPSLQGQILARSGESLDQPSHQTLRLLLAWGSMRPTALADELGVGASYVSKIVRRLEADGLVQRSTDHSDRRASLVHLTDAGVDAARGVYALGDRMITEVLTDWSPSDIRRYTALTERFVADAVRSAALMRERGLLPAEEAGGVPTEDVHPPTPLARRRSDGARWSGHSAVVGTPPQPITSKELTMADLGGMADKAKDAAQDHPEKVDQAKDKAKDALPGQDDK